MLNFKATLTQAIGKILRLGIRHLQRYVAALRLTLVSPNVVFYFLYEFEACTLLNLSMKYFYFFHE